MLTLVMGTRNTRARTAGAKIDSVEFLSSDYYKDALNKPWNTFTSRGPQAQMNYLVAQAIIWLQNIKRDFEGRVDYDLDAPTKAKYSRYIQEDIAVLESNPALSNPDGFHALLVGNTHGKRRGLFSSLMGRSREESSNYFQLILTNLKEELSKFQTTYSRSRPNRTAERVTALPVSAATRPLGGVTHRTGAAAVPLIAPRAQSSALAESQFRTKARTLKSALEEYQSTRTNEWAFHYDFLYAVTGFYYLLKYFGFSNDFDVKQRCTKLNAAGKLITILNDSVLQLRDNGGVSETLLPHEVAALKEGRLGKIIAASGDAQRFNRLIETNAFSFSASHDSDGEDARECDGLTGRALGLQ